MTVPTSDNREQYLGNDSATSFDYAFKIFKATDLTVILTASDGTETTLVRGTDYSVDGVGEEAGGSVTYPLSGSPLATGETLTILREIPVVQETDLRNQGAYYPETLEDEFDRSRMIDQQLAEAQARTLKKTRGGEHYDAGGARIENLGNAAADSDALTSKQMKDYYATIRASVERANDFIEGAEYLYLGNYAGGITIEHYNELVRDSSGEFWRVSGSTSLPYTSTGSGLPEGGAFVTVGDAALRQELAAAVATGQGGLMVSGSVIYVDTIADLQALPTSELVDGQIAIVSGNETGIFKFNGASWVRQPGYYDNSSSGLQSETVPGAIDELAESRVQYVASVSDLISASANVGEVIKTLGYSSPGDGGGNDYEVVAGGTGTDDGGTYINLNNGNQARGLFPGDVSLDQFGVDKTGTTSIASQFNSALAKCKASNKTLRVPIGEYLFNSKPNDIDFPLQLRGGGMNSTVFKRDYVEALTDAGLLNFRTASSNGFMIDQLSVIATGGSGGCGVSVKASSSDAMGGWVLSNLWISSSPDNLWGARALVIDGRAKTTSPIGIRDTNLRNVFVFNGPTGNAVIQGVVHFHWSNGGIFFAGGSGTDGLRISSVAGVESQDMTINLDLLGDLNLDFTDRLVWTGPISGNVNNTGNCDRIVILGPVTGTVQTSWTNSSHYG